MAFEKKSFLLGLGIGIILGYLYVTQIAKDKKHDLPKPQPQPALPPVVETPAPPAHINPITNNELSTNDAANTVISNEPPVSNPLQQEEQPQVVVQPQLTEEEQIIANVNNSIANTYQSGIVNKARSYLFYTVGGYTQQQLAEMSNDTIIQTAIANGFPAPQQTLPNS